MRTSGTVDRAPRVCPAHGSGWTSTWLQSTEQHEDPWYNQNNAMELGKPGPGFYLLYTSLVCAQGPTKIQVVFWHIQ